MAYSFNCDYLNSCLAHCSSSVLFFPPQTTIMKFLALALTILLAAATQAVPMQADAPSQLEHVKVAMMEYMAQVKETAQRSIDLLDDTEFKEYKVQLSQSLDNLQQYAQTTSQSLAPYSEAFGAQLTDAAAAVRAEVMKDVEELRTQLEPKRAELKEVLDKHIDEYRKKLEPLIKEIVEQRRTELEAFRVKMEPVVEEMRAKVSTNVEETKAKLMPIVETVRAKLTERLEELRTLAAPYAEEYKEQMFKAVGEVREKVGPLTNDFKGQVGPAAEQAKEKLMAFYETISQAIKA
uniref:Apolipoprotein A-Ib n=2 Tax=Salmo TaxID=8028 RepID=A0A674CE29_SALTR